MSAAPQRTTSYEGKSIMSSKKKTSTTTADAGLQTLKIGSRVRCTDDQAEGRIVWANGVSVKIKWDDGEQVSWRRDSLAGRPIEILADNEDQPAPAAAPEPNEPAAAEPPPAAPEAAQEPPAAATSASEQTTAETPPAAAEATPRAGADVPGARACRSGDSCCQRAGADGRQAEAGAEGRG